MKLGVSIGSRRVGRRLAAIETYEFPSNVRRRVHLKHPSTLVDDMWHEFLLHTRDYAAFCDAAIGQFLHHEPEPRMSLDQAPANRSDGLLIILQRARQDDHCGPYALRLLFRVDQEAQLPGCRRYHVDCGGESGATTRRARAGVPAPSIAGRPAYHRQSVVLLLVAASVVLLFLLLASGATLQR